MNRPLTTSILLALAIAGSASSASAAGFECPWRTIEGGRYSSEVSSLLPNGDAFEDVARLNASVYALRQQGIGAPLVIDTLISSYCPIVAANPALDDDQKNRKLANFVARVTQLVETLESATAIILDVPLSPATVAAVGVKARAAGVSSEQWIATLVEAAAQK